MTTKLLIALSTVMLFLNCSSNTAGGTTTETTGGYAGIVLANDGTPVANADVALYNVNTGMYEYKTRTDAYGDFTFYPESLSAYHLYVRSPDSSSVFWQYFPLSSEDDTIKAILADPASVNISVLGVPADIGLYLAATPFYTYITDSVASWDELPAGSYTLYDSIGSNVNILGSFSVVSGSNTELALGYDTAGFLLDDFNDGDSLPLFFPWINYRWRKESGTITSFTDRVESDPTGGFYLHIADSSSGILRKAIIKIGEGMDLSDLDSITFRAKGDGVLRVALEEKYGPENDDMNKIFFKVVLSADWTSYTIDVNNYSASEIEYFNISSWDQMKSSVDYFTLFMYPGEKELYIDDIRLHGVNSDIFLP